MKSISRGGAEHAEKSVHHEGVNGTKNDLFNSSFIIHISTCLLLPANQANQHELILVEGHSVEGRESKAPSTEPLTVGPLDPRPSMGFLPLAAIRVIRGRGALAFPLKSFGGGRKKPRRIE
jgi:hypothetical protein